MASNPLPRPTDAELAILRVLWKKGASTVKKVHETLGEGTGYTTVLKLLQIMTEKGLVARDEAQRAHVYRVARPEAETQRQIVTGLLNKVFGGSSAQLVMQALSSKRASKEELAEIRKLIDQLSKEKQ